MKEQEARRRKQKEEEERRVNAVAESNDPPSNGKLKAGTNLGEREDKKTEPLNADDLSSTGISSINGNSSPQESKEYQDITTRRAEDDESWSNGKDDQILYENEGKVRYEILFICMLVLEDASYFIILEQVILFGCSLIFQVMFLFSNSLVLVELWLLVTVPVDIESCNVIEIGCL